MKHRMKFLGYRNGKELWRGTGFALNPGEVTVVDPHSLFLWHQCQGHFFIGSEYAQA